MSYHQPQLPAWYAGMLTFRVRAPVRSPYSHMYAKKICYDVWRDAAEVEIEAFFQWRPSLRCSDIVTGCQALRMEGLREEGTKLGLLQWNDRRFPKAGAVSVKTPQLSTNARTKAACLSRFLCTRTFCCVRGLLPLSLLVQSSGALSTAIAGLFPISFNAGGGQ